MKETLVNDLQLAAYLTALGYSLQRVEGSQHRRTFVFNAPEEVIAAYYGDRDQTSARKLFGAYRDLRGLAAQVL
jgi:hypothetical protein